MARENSVHPHNWVRGRPSKTSHRSAVRALAVALREAFLTCVDSSCWWSGWRASPWALLAAVPNRVTRTAGTTARTQVRTEASARPTEVAVFPVPAEPIRACPVQEQLARERPV